MKKLLIGLTLVSTIILNQSCTKKHYYCPAYGGSVEEKKIDKVKSNYV